MWHWLKFLFGGGYVEFCRVQAANEAFKRENELLRMELSTRTEECKQLIDACMMNAGVAPLFSALPDAPVKPINEFHGARTGRDFASIASRIQNQVDTDPRLTKHFQG